MFDKVLFLEKCGCDFTRDETAKSDIGNYRVCTHDETIPGKDGNMYFLEFHLWRNRQKARYLHKITGKPLKQVAYDIINQQGVAIDTEFTNDRGCWRNCTLEEELAEKNYSYTQADILTIVNEISTQEYNRIIFADVRAIQAISKIQNRAGYREKNILDNLTEVKRTQADKNYLVYRYIAGNKYFEYDVFSNKITM
jgi:hypothetical protein